MSSVAGSVMAIRARQTLAVGDTVYDVVSAKQNGIGTPALHTGPFTDEELEAAGAITTYENVADILGDLDRVLTLRG